MSLRRVVGIHSSEEALKVRPQAISKIYVKKEHKELGFFVDISQKHKIPLEITHDKNLLSLSSCTHHQGVLVEVQEEPQFDEASLADKSQVLILDHIESPHNLGAIIRTAWLMDVKAIFIPSHGAVKLNSTVMKVAQGGAEHVPVIKSSLLKVINDLKKEGFWTYALSEKSKTSLWSPSLDLGLKVLWVAGSEKKGIRKPILNQCDQLLCIPQTTPDASLNVSVAVALAISHTHKVFLGT